MTQPRDTAELERRRRKDRIRAAELRARKRAAAARRQLRLEDCL